MWCVREKLIRFKLHESLNKVTAWRTAGGAVAAVAPAPPEEVWSSEPPLAGTSPQSISRISCEC